MKTENRNGLLAVSAAADEIQRVSIVQLGGKTMGQWYDAQVDKPDMLMNGSLWDKTGAIGTIWQDGKLVRNEGNGFGFGVNKAGGWGFADPWGVSWRDYITGYPALVKAGKALSDGVDNYVMNSKTKRSVVAVAGNRLYFIAADSMTITGLRKALVSFGVYSAINLDGGGSSRLLVNGRAVNHPTDDRRCPNAIAVWLTKKPEPTKGQSPGGALGGGLAEGTTPEKDKDTTGENPTRAGTQEDEGVRKITVAIDAGHGKHTAGKRCLKSLDPNETREWTLNSRIAAKVCARLEAAGVHATRVDDITGESDVALSERTAKANAAGCALYVSIHHDSGVNGGTGGGVTVFSHPKGSAKAVTLRDAVYEHVMKTGGLRGNRANPKTTADFYVLRKTSMPAVLIECGFMDSKTDLPVILTDAYAENAARGIAEGVCEVLGVKTLKEAEDVGKDTKEIPSAWAAESWVWAKDNGLMDGTRPKDAVTREELAAVLKRMAQSPGGALGGGLAEGMTPERHMETTGQNPTRAGTQKK